MADATTTAATVDTATAAAAATTTAAAAPTTAITTAAATTAAAATPASWPATWREDMAKGDEKALQRLQRFTAPPDIFTSYRALEQRVSSGELKAVSPFPAKGTPEQQNAWRKENGIPEKPEAYDLKFDDGLVVGEEDKGWVDSYLKAAHAGNIPNAQVKETLKWYFGYKDAEADSRQQADSDVARKTVDALRAEWQGDYRVNMNGIEALLALAPKGVAEKLKASRFSDGTPIMSDPDTLKFLAGMFRQVNPVSSVVPAGDEAGMMKSISDELTQIRNTMRTNRSAYNKDEKMQARYRELVDAESRLKGTKKAA